MRVSFTTYLVANAYLMISAQACDFTATFSPCTYGAFRTASSCSNGDMINYFQVSTTTEAQTAFAQACANADDDFLTWSSVTKRGYQFDKEFFNGGTIFNEEFLTNDAPQKFRQDTERLKLIKDNVVESHGIAWPDNIKNFDTDDSCESEAAMCCWIADRDKAGGGTCNRNGFECQDEDPVDNTDVCYVDMENSRESSHVRSGVAYYPGDSEGAVHCSGFMWTAQTDKYKGNLLFEVAMSHGLLDNGYVRNVPGAPMCACLEQMPVVSKATCTDLSVTESFQFSSTDTYESLNHADVAVSFSNCGGADLADYYKAQRNGNIDEYITGDCDDVLAAKLAESDYEESAVEWVNVAGKGRLYEDYMSDEEFRSIWADSSNKILRRRCNDCAASHQDIYYRRLNDANGELPEGFDLLHIVKDAWFTSPEIENHEFNVDFALYSTYANAVADTNRWQHCEFNTENVGFPHNCGPNGRVTNQWNTFTSPLHGRHWGQPHVGFYVEGS